METIQDRFAGHVVANIGEALTGEIRKAVETVGSDANRRVRLSVAIDVGYDAENGCIRPEYTIVVKESDITSRCLPSLPCSPQGVLFDPAEALN